MNQTAAGGEAAQPGEATDGRGRIRAWLFGGMFLLYVISVPWYRDDDAPLVVVLGLPDWVAVALACYGGVAILNCIAWALTEIKDLPPAERVEPATEHSERGEA
ncbi:MAG: hypothetical protein ACI8W3_000278 [Myxococcota bacterium]|jgi:hypothetical protein